MKDDIELLMFKEFLCDVIKTIREWKRNQAEAGFRKSENITLPESLWLLNLIDAMGREGFLMEAKSN